MGRRDAHHLVEALLESIELPVIACAADGRLTHANRCSRELIGGGCSIGMSASAWLTVLVPRTPSGLPLALEDVPLMRALEGEAVRGVDMLVRASDRDVLLSACASPVEDRRGRRRGAVAVLEDVTEQRAREAQARAEWRA
jgi:PAS domain-containing protein